MILWTFQPIEIWELLQMKGVYRCDPARIDPDFEYAYKWLVQKVNYPRLKSQA